MVTNGFMHEFTRQNGDVPFAHVGSRVGVEVWPTGQRAAKMYPSSPPQKKKGFIPLALVYIPCICHMLHGTGIFTYIWLKSMVNVGE